MLFFKRRPLIREVSRNNHRHAGVSRTMWKSGMAWLALLVGAAAADLAASPHPRLWFTQAMEVTLREQIAADPLAARMHARALAEADAILGARTCRYHIPDGRRLLAESRLALRNIISCAWAWRVSGREDYRRRVIEELEAACSLKDWNPAHFLDTAEMATAVAIGYDWLHATLTPAQRVMCQRAIIDKALIPAKAAYDAEHWWTLPRNNWAQVCGSGIALAAAALAGDDEGLAGGLFSRGLALLGQCEGFYQPDGMYPEGPGYWQYGTNYHVMLLAACGPLGQVAPCAPVLRKAGESVMHLTSPTRLAYNFADGHAHPVTPSAAQCWLARHYRDRVQAGHVREFLRRAFDEHPGDPGVAFTLPLALLWLPDEPEAGTRPPLAAVFHGEQPVALFRNGWRRESVWFGIKGGTPAVSHGHMDVGSFVYDAHGRRWLHDLGPENYNLPGHFAERRWRYYRLQNRSHNTLEIGGMLQDPESAACPLVFSSLTGAERVAQFDLSAAYRNAAARVTRTARFQTRKGVVRIEDEITAPVGEVVWRAFTDADVEISGHRVTLRRGNDGITLRQVSTAGSWSIAEARPPTAVEKQNEGYRAITLTAPQAAVVRLAVEIAP